MNAEQIMERLREIAPNVAFSVSRESDPYFSWDGEGPDPRDEGFEPCNVTVTAKAIVNGRTVEGHDYLGGSYFKPDEKCGDVHGYLPQMLLEASEDLRLQSPIEHGSPLDMALGHVAIFLNAEMRNRYNEQMAEHNQLST